MALVQWLTENFEIDEDASIPRDHIYALYLRHCQEQQLEPINTACFGKLVNKHFKNLKPCRLGSRENSKYHYGGICKKKNSLLNGLKIETATRQCTSKASRLVSSSQPSKEETDSLGEYQKFVIDTVQALPDFDQIQTKRDDPPMPPGITQEDLVFLEDHYKKHCRNIFENIIDFQFSNVEYCWLTFWRIDTSENPQTMTFENKLQALYGWPPVQRWMKNLDFKIYRHFVEILIPDVLRPIPNGLIGAIRSFANVMKDILKNLLSKSDLPEEMLQCKISTVSLFSNTLLRYTDLNHLAKTLFDVLNNSDLTSQMLSDIKCVDFSYVKQQVSRGYQFHDSVSTQLETAFVAVIAGQITLEQLTDSLKRFVDEKLQPHKMTDRLALAAGQLILKWVYGSSLVLQYLTLRSAKSFGHFIVMQTFFNDYISYVAQRMVWQESDKMLDAVMGQAMEEGIESATVAETDPDVISGAHALMTLKYGI